MSHLQLRQFLSLYRQVAQAVSCTVLEKIENLTKDYDVIGIDEGQFVSTI